MLQDEQIKREMTQSFGFKLSHDKDMPHYCSLAWKAIDSANKNVLYSSLKLQ